MENETKENDSRVRDGSEEEHPDHESSHVDGLDCRNQRGLVAHQVPLWKRHSESV